MSSSWPGGDEVVDGGVVEPVDEFVGPGEQHRIRVRSLRASAHKAIAWSMRSVGVDAMWTWSWSK